jgi:hypothetical protein
LGSYYLKQLPFGFFQLVEELVGRRVRFARHIAGVRNKELSRRGFA